MQMRNGRKSWLELPGLTKQKLFRQWWFMKIVFSAEQNLIGLWQEGWAYVAIQRPVAVVSGRNIAWIYLESIAEFNGTWTVIEEL